MSVANIDLENPRIMKIKTRFRNLFPAFAISLCLGGCLTISGVATAATWDGDTSGTWSVAANWTTNTAPVTPEALTFAGTANVSTNNDFAADTVFNGITFASGAGAFTLAGNQMKLGGNITNSSSNLQTISLTLNNTASRSIDTGAAGISLSNVAGGGTYTKSGTGTLTLSGATSNSNLGLTLNQGTVILNKTATNALTGALTISAGTLQLSGTGGDQIHFNVAMTMNSAASAIFDLNGKSEEIGKLQGTGGTVTNTSATASTFTIGGGTNNSDSSSILIQDGVGKINVITRHSAASTTYVLNGANTYTGTTTIGGITTVSTLANGGSASSVGASGTAAANLVITNNATLKYTGGTVSIDRGFTAGGTGSTIEVTNSGTTLTFTGSAAGVTKTGAGTLVLSGVNSWANPTANGGTLRIANPTSQAISGTMTANSGGTLQLGGSNSNQVHDNSTVAINTGGFLDMAGLSEKVKNISGAGTVMNSSTTLSTLTVSGFSGSTTFDGSIQGKVALSHSDPTSSTTLNGLNTYSGDTTIGSSTATFTVGGTGGLTFYPTTNGVSNWVNGTAGATVNLNGTFTFDLTNTAISNGNLWNIVEVGDFVETFGGTFAVNGFTEAANVWTKVDGSNTWSFSESTGALTLAVIPEPASILLGGLGMVALLRRRRA